MSRAVMQQALEALEKGVCVDPEESHRAIYALRQALAELEQPVAWVFRYSDGSFDQPSLTEHSSGMIPLYTAPTPRSPVELTDEEIINIGKEARAIEGPNILPVSFARAVIAAYERKNGIKGGQHE